MASLLLYTLRTLPFLILMTVDWKGWVCGYVLCSSFPARVHSWCLFLFVFSGGWDGLGWVGRVECAAVDRTACLCERK